MHRVSDRWKDLPDYILGITREIWEDRGIASLHDYYAPDMILRSPMGIQRGNQSVIASTMATIHEFPDRQLYGEDVIWSDDPDHGLLSSHRVITRATHSGDGQFGTGSGTQWTIRVIADCAVRDDVIYDEWLVRDYGGIVRQLGKSPAEFAARLVAEEVAASGQPSPVFRPEHDIDGGYHGRGNDNAWGAKYADILNRILSHDFGVIRSEYDRAIIGAYAGAQDTLGWDQTLAFWIALRASLPSAVFTIHHQIGMEGGTLSPRAAIRWSLDGTHDGWGTFGPPSGKRVHVFGISHAEFGPWGLRRECALYDEIAVFKQIRAHTG
ncbi:MAG: ester cyclase [Pseudomonadota bacterium]